MWHGVAPGVARHGSGTVARAEEREREREGAGGWGGGRKREKWDEMGLLQYIRLNTYPHLNIAHSINPTHNLRLAHSNQTCTPSLPRRPSLVSPARHARTFFHVFPLRIVRWSPI